MELSNSAREMIVQAQTLLLNTGGNKLCVEHLFYGVLLLADYLEPPLNKAEFRKDGEKVRAWLEDGRLLSVAAARKQLRQDAEDGGSMFVDAAPVLGRAAEIAGGSEIGAMELARAVMETSSPTVRALCGLTNPRVADEDARYHQKAQKKAEPSPGRGGGNAGAAAGKDKATSSQIEALLALLALANSRQTDELRQNAKPRAAAQKPGKPKVVRRTKMGLFTYRGGTAAAAFQYFLFGILVPGAVLAGISFIVNKTTGGSFGRMQSLFDFLLYAFISVWIFYLARGVSLLFGLISCAFGNFLDILLDMGLIALLVTAIKYAWHMPVVPVWLRVVSCAVAFLVLSTGIVLFDHLRDEGDVTKTRVNFQNKQGTPGKIFFQSLAENCRVLLLVFAILWITRITPPAVIVHILWILGFFWVWNNVFNAYACLCIRCTSGRHRGLAFFQFLHAAHLFFIIPEFVFFLHWHFQWFPMKHWVMIVLGVYSVIAFFFSIMYARIK